MKKDYKNLSLPVESTYRLTFRLAQPELSSSSMVVGLERKYFGPFWTELDCRVKDNFTELSTSDQDSWYVEAELDLLEEWFAEELAELRK